MRVLTCIIALGLVGCGPHSEKETCNPLPPVCHQTQEVIYDSFAEWSIRTGNSLDLDIKVAPVSEMNDNTSVPRTINVFKKDPKPGYVGWTWNGNGNAALIYLKPGLSHDEFHHVALHEEGHALGPLPHYLGARPSIMTPDVSEITSLQCEDIEAYCSMRDCSPCH